MIFTSTLAKPSIRTRKFPGQGHACNTRRSNTQPTEEALQASVSLRALLFALWRAQSRPASSCGRGWWAHSNQD